MQRDRAIGWSDFNSRSFHNVASAFRMTRWPAALMIRFLCPSMSPCWALSWRHLVVADDLDAGWRAEVEKTIGHRDVLLYVRETEIGGRTVDFENHDAADLMRRRNLQQHL